MRVLLLGCNGQLGRCLKDLLKDTKLEVIYTSRSQIDVTDFKNARLKIAEKEPDVIINSTAYTNVDKAEEDFLTANLVNHLAVENLANICSRLSCWLIHISTDYVFDGNSKKPYVELDKTNPQSVYGTTKLKGELAVKASGCKYLILRTAWVYSEYENNFLKKMLQLGAVRDKLNIVGDQIGCPTYAQDIATAIISIISKLNTSKELDGIYHYSGDSECSWFEFAKEIFKQANKYHQVPIPNLKKVSTEEFTNLAKRTKFSALANLKVQEKFDITSSNFKYGIESTLREVFKI